MQLKQQRDQGDDPGNRFHHLFLSNSEKWYISHLYITFHLLTYSQLVSGAPSRDEGPSVQAPWVSLHGPGSSVPPTQSLLSDGNALSLSSQATAAASRTAIWPPDVLPGTHKPDLHLLESRCTIIPDEDPQRDVETPNHEGEDGDGLEEELGEEDDPQDDDNEADDDLDEPETPPSSSRQRRPFPVWLMDQFNARHEESKSRNADGLPPLYSDYETFWFPQKLSFFFLRRQSCSPLQLYNPQFFLWDPECLCNRIPCPNCKQSLQQHGEISHPWRCVSLDSTFWIIGYHYRCGNCFHPRTKKRTVTFRSWDPRILAVLPPALTAEFPAHLTHRSGISNVLFSWMRSCF